MGNLIRWHDPMFSLVNREVSRFWDDFLRPTAWWPVLMDIPFAGDNLAVDMYETDDALHIEAAMPGIRPEDIIVEEHNGILSIKAEQKEENTWQNGEWRIRERHMGLWQRAVRLPVEVKIKKASAVLENGVVHIVLPKKHPEKRKIQRLRVKFPKLRLPQSGNRKKVKVRAS